MCILCIEAIISEGVHFLKILLAGCWYREAATTGGILKKGVLKNLANFIEKHLRWSLFLLKLQPCNTSAVL